MKKHKPDFLLHSGDTIYADGLIPSEVKLADGKVWKNVTIPEKAKVAETLDEYRAAHKYNFLDDNVRAFNAEVPIFVQWDDHEVTNNWSLSKDLPAAYKERNITLLAARAARAFHEMYPMRESIVEPGRVYRTLSYGPHLDVFMPNTISPEKYPVLREKFIDLFSLSSGPLNTSDRVAELLCCLPTFQMPDGLTYENVFRVTIVQFLDRFNFCVGNVKRSCIHFVTPSGAIIPFDTYNLFYRNGKIDGIRAAMAGRTHRARKELVPR